jgi:hypothetical protein
LGRGNKLEETKNIRPWDIFKKNVDKVQDLEFKKRMDICNQCPEFIKLTTQCKQCGCVMGAKAKLFQASCPIGKWGVADIPIYHEVKGETE